jgi:hypothetical protein
MGVFSGAIYSDRLDAKHSLKRGLARARPVRSPDADDHQRQIAQFFGFDLARQKRAKLNQSLGSRSRSTLLDDKVRAAHADRLRAQFLKLWGGLAKEDEQRRLRLWTLADSIVPLRENAVLDAVDRMHAKLETVYWRVPGVQLIGAIEVEVCNLALMRQLASHEAERRKLRLIEELAARSEEPAVGSSSQALIQFHGLIDLGDRTEVPSEALASAARRFWPRPSQARHERLRPDLSVREALTGSAAYMVKGGNENLLYKLSFGYDTREKLERQFLGSNQAIGCTGPDAFARHMSLSIDEIGCLGTVIDRFMGWSGGQRTRSGYLVRFTHRAA